jgi:hypothetical protein
MCMIVTLVLRQLLPPTTLFLPLLDRLTLASSDTSNVSEAHASTWVGFRLLILLSVVLVS